MAAYLFAKKVRTGIISIISMLSIASCSSEGYLKKKIIDEIRSANGKDVAIDLKEFSKEKILRLCIQSPYLTKEAMEKRAGGKIDGFNEVDDKFFILWIFIDRQVPMRIKFHRWHELNFGEQSKGCVSTSKVKIINSQLYLNEEK